MSSLWMIAATACFALMGVCIKLVGKSLDLGDIVFYRAAINLVAAALLLKVQGVSWRTARAPLHVQRGLVGMMSMVLQFFTITQLPLATAMTLSYTSPIFLALLSVAILGARPTWLLNSSLVLGFLGVIVLLKPPLAPSQYFAASIGLASSLFAALAYYNVGRLVRSGEAEIRIVFYFALTGTICSSIWLAFNGWHPLDGRSTLYALGIGTFGTLGQLTMTRAYGQGHPMITGALSYSAIIFSSVLGYLIWREALVWTSWCGILLIIISGLMAMRSRQSNPRPTRPDPVAE